MSGGVVTPPRPPRRAGVLVLCALLAVGAVALGVGMLAVGADAEVGPSVTDGAGGPGTATTLAGAENGTTTTDTGAGTGTDTASTMSVSASRTETIVGTPVTFQADSAVATWNVSDAPAGSEATLRDGNAGTVSLQPDVAGIYEITAVETTSGTGTEAVSDTAGTGQPTTVTVEAREQTAVIAEFAPRVHFHEDGPYRPTRLEALVENAALRHATDGTVREENLTVFDLADRGDGHYLSLHGETRDYPAYQEAFEPTVYANYVPEVSFEGDTYSAIHYWFVYTYDPKHGFAVFGAHQGDVERTSVLLDGDDPAYVLPAGHGGQTVAPYEQWAGDDGRLDVFVEHRSHASYLRDTTAFDGEGYQVYEFWGDSGAACDDVARFESTFHNEWTGSDGTWEPPSRQGEIGSDGSEQTGDYRIVELDGNETWASYEGGLAEAPGSIQIPQARTVYDDPGPRFGRACHDRDQVRGSLTVDDVRLDTDGGDALAPTSGTVEVTVANAGGKPHEFWVTVESADGDMLGSEAVPVGTTRWELVDGQATASVPFAYDGEGDVTAQLWLHPPETREDGDHIETVTVVEDGEIVAGGFSVPFGVWVAGGVGLVVLGSWGYRRRRYH